MTETTHMPLAGHRAIVTGAGRGIGRSIALALAEAGADVAVTARTNAEIEQVAAEIKALGRAAVAIPCDVTDAAQVSQMAAQTVAAMGAIDILVNNAGMGASHKFVTYPDDLWNQVMAVNLNSVFYVSKAFAPSMVEKKWGRIINVASIASKTGGKYMAAYSASKHGVLGLTRALAAEFVKDNVTVNAICPGYVDTPMTDRSIANMVNRTGMSEDKAREYLENLSPQQRLIEPEEVAAMTVFLAQESSKGITGQAINIDGGMVMF